MVRWAHGLAAAWLALCALLVPQAGLAGEGPVSGEADQLSAWVQRTDDHRGRPYAIVDKREARLHVFDARGRLVGSTAALLGQAPGDDIAPGVGEHAQAGWVPFEERTTPAGRFESEPGVNLAGEHVVWVDYESAFAIHRLRPGPGLRDREQRLVSDSAADKRVSLGCVVVPVKFYLEVVQPMLGRARSVVYVMPERGSLQQLFTGL